MPFLLLIFVVVPLIEITLFVTIGGAIGLWPTLAIVVGTAFLGSWLMRRQGARALADVQRAFNEFSDPTGPLAHGALILVAGVLLISPGFFTDTLGLLLLLRPVRDLVLRGAGRKVSVRVGGGFSSRPAEAAPHRYGRGVVIDGDYVEEPPAAPRRPEAGPDHGAPRRPSGWTRGGSHD